MIERQLTIWAQPKAQEGRGHEQLFHTSFYLPFGIESHLQFLLRRMMAGLKVNWKILCHCSYDKCLKYWASIRISLMGVAEAHDRGFCR